jgi:hypothetical protein
LAAGCPFQNVVTGDQVALLANEETAALIQDFSLTIVCPERHDGRQNSLDQLGQVVLRSLGLTGPSKRANQNQRYS